MDRRLKLTSRIENFFSMLLTKAAISDNLFIGDMPSILGDDWKDMVLCDVLSIRDYGGYCKGQANVFLYAKSLGAQGVKPVKALYGMELKLDNSIEVSRDSHYVIDVNFRDAGYDGNRGYYYNVVNIEVTIR